ncbi:hypothetical protein GCM10009539_03050 [Cryptosporangium japonicum]|uniref:Uncharacterized protein n=1 Tax=Cryptosporangium japonicum TaxID=80872 RepID=A0ABP3D2U5_9ACTN
MPGAGSDRVRSDPVDVADADAARDRVDTVAAECGRIDVLVDHAGILRDNRIENISVDGIGSSIR